MWGAERGYKHSDLKAEQGCKTKSLESRSQGNTDISYTNNQQHLARTGSPRTVDELYSFSKYLLCILLASTVLGAVESIANKTDKSMPSITFGVAY